MLIAYYCTNDDQCENIKNICDLNVCLKANRSVHMLSQYFRRMTSVEISLNNNLPVTDTNTDEPVDTFRSLMTSTVLSWILAIRFIS